jgi:hypothetical protein
LMIKSCSNCSDLIFAIVFIKEILLISF